MNHLENFVAIAPDVKLGQGVKIYRFVNLYGCEIGDETKIGTFVEIQKGVQIGKRCKISSHTFICEGVSIEDEVFVGHGVMFTNDLYPRATAPSGRLQIESDWAVVPTRISKGATIGSGAVVIAGITLGEYCMVAAGATVTKNVPAYAVVAGNPARQQGWVCSCGRKLVFQSELGICQECQNQYRKAGSNISLL